MWRQSALMFCLVNLAWLSACGGDVNNKPTTVPALSASPEHLASPTQASPTPSLEQSPTPAPRSSSPTPIANSATLVTYSSGDPTLRGFVFKPEGPGPFPAVLYNHGSEKLPGDKASVAQVFLQAGYVVFVPHRRGQGRSDGEYIVDTLSHERAGSPAWGQLLVHLHETAQLQDQTAAFQWLSAQPYVDRGRIAIAGCSYGGIQTVLAAETLQGARAAVDFAGAAQSWDLSPDLRVRMIGAMENIKMPIFLLQAANDYSIQPTLVLGAELQRLGKPFKQSVYPAFGQTKDDGHAGFCFDGGSVWGPDVLAFLAENLRPPR